MIDKTYIFKLAPLSAFHIGTSIPAGVNARLTDEIIHSDTFASAIANVWAQTYTDSISELLTVPRLIISSLFPYSGDILLFPKPRSYKFKQAMKEENPDIGKEFKKIKFVDMENFFNLIRGSEISLENKTDCGKFIGITKAPYKKYEAERTPVDRLTNESGIFSIEEIVFEKDCGYYFLAKFFDNTIFKKFCTVLRILGDTGLGAERSTGKGYFSVKEINEINLNITESNSNKFVLLSLYIPKEEEIRNGLLEGSAYGLDTRGGWIYSSYVTNLKKKRVRVFTEGSVFTKPENIKPPYGKSVILMKQNEKIPHDVFRYGFCFHIDFQD